MQSSCIWYSYNKEYQEICKNISWNTVLAFFSIHANFPELGIDKYQYTSNSKQNYGYYKPNPDLWMKFGWDLVFIQGFGIVFGNEFGKLLWKPNPQIDNIEI